MTELTYNPAEYLPNIYGKDGNRRADIERRLNANVQVGSLFSAIINDDGVTYRLTTAGGTQFSKVSLSEADMICSVAMGAFNEGRAR